MKFIRSCQMAKRLSGLSSVAENSLERFWPAHLQLTLGQFPTNSIFHEVFIELVLEELVVLVAIVMIAEVVQNALDDVVHFVPFAFKKQVFHFIGNIGVFSPVVAIGLFPQGLTHYFSKGFRA